MSLKEKLTCRYPALFLFISLLAIKAVSQLPQAQMDSLARELVKAKEDSNKVQLLMTLGNEAGYTDLNKALEYALQGYELSKKIGYQKGIGNLAYLSGISYIDLGNYALADSFLSIAGQKFTELNIRRNIFKVYNARGNSDYRQGKYWNAADNLTKAAEGFDELKDTAYSLIAYQNLISVLGQINNHPKAVELGKKVLKIAEAGTDTLQIGYTLQALTSDLIHSGRYDEAWPYLQKLLTIAEKTLDNSLAAESFSAAGAYYYKTNDPVKATYYFQRSISRAEKLDDKYQLANHYHSLGQVLLQQKKMPGAKEYLLKAMQLAGEFNNKKAEYNTALSLSEYYEQTGDYPTGIKFLKTHLALKDSILNAETRNYSSYLETRYQTNKKENEILRLQKIQQQKDFAIKRRNTWLGIGIGLIAALISILYLLKRNYGHKQKLARQQSVLLEEKIKTIEKEQQISSLQSMINGQETERTRIAKDLHDGLGGIFSTVKMHYSTLQQDTPGIKENPLYKKTLDLINNASDELRKVAHNMMPEVLMKVGLLESLQDLANNISSGKLLKVTLQAFGMEKRLASSTEIMLYRIIQELVNNIIKHAYASEAIIQINREGNRLSLTIEDNGKGFDTREAEERRSMGMATVRSRVDYLNGKLTIDSRKDIGTTVMIDLLLNEN